MVHTEKAAKNFKHFSNNKKMEVIRLEVFQDAWLAEFIACVCGFSLFHPINQEEWSNYTYPLERTKVPL